MNGRYSRRKGADFERALVHRFREAMPDADIRRGLQCRSGEEAPDVEVPCFWLEAKRHHKTNIMAAIRQAIADCPKGKFPLAVCKNDGELPVATMLLDDFLELIGEWWKARQS